MKVPHTLAALRLHTEAKSLRSLAAFGPEMVRVMVRIFDSALLTEDLLSYCQEAVLKAHLYAAATSYWGSARLVS